MKIIRVCTPEQDLIRRIRELRDTLDHDDEEERRLIRAARQCACHGERDCALWFIAQVESRRRHVPRMF